MKTSEQQCVDLRKHFIRPSQLMKGDSPPACYARTNLELPKTIASASLQYTAFGIVEPWLNGQPLNDDRFLPGWSDYRKRVYVVKKPVGHVLKKGSNILGFILGNGWAGFTYGPWEHAKCLVDFTALSAELSVEYTDGTKASFVSTPDWRWAQGPVTSQSLYHGEHYDARKKLTDWTTPNFDKRRWKTGKAVSAPQIELTPRKCPPVRVTEQLAPEKIWKGSNGHWLVDFGQNLVGVVRLQVKEKSGQKIKLRFAEMLQDDGQLYTENLRGARATDIYICSGNGKETISPRWTFHGFRYAEIDGLSHPPKPEEISAQVLHNDLKPTGNFKTSNTLINQLQRCIVWGQRGNFLEAPTDCPQRDERLGWSGDAQVFVKTACFNYDCEDFYRQWMDAMRDGQRTDGAFPDLAPDVLGWHGNAGWGDAGIIVPHAVWQFYGNTSIVAENWSAMESYLSFLIERGNEYIQPETVYGDWLAVDAQRPEWGPTPKDLIGTAYFARDAGLISEMAQAIGKLTEANRYATLQTNVQRAFQKRYITPEGLVLGDTQTSYLLALAFDLVPENLVSAAGERLIEKLKARDWHLSTGFLGTPLLNPVLTKIGRTDVAYKVLEQETYPGWLYPILNGATTMWERWNSWTREHGFGPVEMNSFNHYAYGAIGEWLYATVAGLNVDNSTEQPIVSFSPRPGNSLKSASASLMIKQGKLACGWKLNSQGLKLKIDIPKGAKSRVSIPAKSWRTVQVNGKSVSRTPAIEPYQNGRFPSATLKPGSYEIVVPKKNVVIANLGQLHSE
ncbi:alpha-L-rhamnosidase [Rubellicoccus peritrichatus]|uniref:alpha-L-rhamnosidase n=1 Tax=Rubellicoccus peritrichatus TaxID=3080537 RepID=A0AAQ3LEM0_9BACT|nr:family 78 glycoside hydrolase catalytic domain [Puniceicoccus sp. CR14]WOO43297.1 family 78 glycoside hydrolase catalytic domain [Puniceicoccus sp. CR14]